MSHIYIKTSLQDLHSVVAAIGGDDAADAVDGDGARAVELAGAAAHAADGAHVRAVGVAEDLNAVVFPVCNDDLTHINQHNADRAFKFSGASS